MLRRIHSLIVLASLALAGCSSVPTSPAVDIVASEAAARAAVADGSFQSAREIYLQLVGATSGDEQRRLQIELARTELRLGDPEAALGTLGSIIPPMPADISTEHMALRAEALFAIGRTVDAVRLLVERDVLLDTSDAILDNQLRIWTGLSRASSRVTAAAARTGDPIVDGWLALAPLTVLTENSDELLTALLDWREQFGNHPAVTGILAERFLTTRISGVPPARMALLLPVGSGSRFSPQARAVQYGFMAAHFASGHADATSVVLYDTSRSGGAASYREALLEGASFIVGPLIADEIPQVLAQAGFIPTLALNVGAGETVGATQFYQFALSSDDEVNAIATRAIAAGQTTAAILHAGTDRGYRLREAFRTAFESRGGQVVDTRAYDSDSANLSTPIEELLNVAASEARYARLNQVLDRPIDVFQPRRRADIDMIFLQIDRPVDARVLVPLLEAYTENAIPTYSTRDAYDPTRTDGDSDLDGLIFPDLPLLLQPVGQAQIAADALAAFGNQYSDLYPREFAFGFDAYKLAETLYAGESMNWPLSGATGELHLGANGRIRRILPFAEFNGGRPRVTESVPGLLSAR